VKKKKEKKPRNNSKKKPKNRIDVENTVTGDDACRTRATTRDLLCSRRPPEDPETTEKTISRDPHAPVQGVTSLARAGPTSSRKNRHGRGWRLLDQKKPVTTVERHVSSKIQPK